MNREPEGQQLQLLMPLPILLQLALSAVRGRCQCTKGLLQAMTKAIGRFAKCKQSQIVSAGYAAARILIMMDMGGAVCQCRPPCSSHRVCGVSERIQLRCMVNTL